MPAELLMVSRFPTKPGTAEALASVLEDVVDGRVFVGLESDEVLAVEAMKSDLDLAGVRARFADVARDFAQYLSGDIRREILDFVEAPKSCAGPLPETPYLQLRHVEVKPEEYSGPVPVLFRSSETDARQNGDRIWQRYTTTSSSEMRFALRSPAA